MLLWTKVSRKNGKRNISVPRTSSRYFIFKSCQTYDHTVLNYPQEVAVILFIIIQSVYRNISSYFKITHKHKSNWLNSHHWYYEVLTNFIVGLNRLSLSTFHFFRHPTCDPVSRQSELRRFTLVGHWLASYI